MDFYRRLSDVRAKGSCGVKLVAVGPKNRETADDIREYLARQDLRVDAVEMVNYSKVGVSGTPTLALEDESGLVREVWFGFLSEKQEAEVLARMGSFCRA
jgi:hypothetical protein